MVIRRVRLDLIEVNPYSLRLSLNDDSRDLASSMKVVGQLSPVLVRPHPRKKGMYQLIYGHRRFLAAKKLGWRYIRADVKRMDDEQMLRIALIENLQRQDLTDYEKAKVFEHLHREFGKTYEEIGRMIGKSRQYVTNHVAMLRLFEPIRDQEREEVESILQSLTEHHARILMRVKDREERLNLARLIVREKMCVREADKLTGRPRAIEFLDFSYNQMDQPTYRRGVVKSDEVTLLSGKRVRVCMVRMEALNTLIANLKKSPYLVGRQIGEQAAEILKEEFDPHLKRNWGKVLRALSRNSAWGRLILRHKGKYVVEVYKAAIADPEFLRGYLEGCLGARMKFKETLPQTHIFEVEE